MYKAGGQMCITFNRVAFRENHDYVLTAYEAQAELMFVFEMPSCRTYRVDMTFTLGVICLRTWSRSQFKLSLVIM